MELLPALDLHSSVLCRVSIVEFLLHLSFPIELPRILALRQPWFLKALTRFESAKSNSMIQTLLLGTLFGLWYLFNIYFNIYNKQVHISLNSCFPFSFLLL
uniref:Uncharacterized protein n=1 Tax=Nelumbo nucifera TaxID=4432 RepID=A0A822Y2E2_NELNU|nr:TPA_asm: hypothetical protein HUJ06_027178 [Nelumbo nucifera]